MKIVHCGQCGGSTPEGFSLCPACMRSAGVGGKEVEAVSDLLCVVNILNIGETDISRITAIEGILSITKKLGMVNDEEKEKS